MTRSTYNLRDWLSKEWNLTIKIRRGSLFLLIAGFIVLLVCGHSYFVEKRFTPTQKYISDIVSKHNVRRHFDGYAYGTFWDDCGVTLTADHVLSQMVDEGETFVGRRVNRSFGVIDAAHFGEWSCGEPRAPVIGEKVSVIGYPSGSVDPALRRGEIYLRREESGSDGYKKPTWIIVFDGREPVAGGMSGGLVISDDGTPLGTLVTQNSATYIPKFKTEKHGSDFVALHDYWNFVIEPTRNSKI